MATSSNNRIPSLQVSEDGVILNLQELLEVLKNINSDVNSISEEDYREIENLGQLVSNDNNSEDKLRNEEELIGPIYSIIVKHKAGLGSTNEELLNTLKINKDDAINLDIINTKATENDSAKDKTYLTVVKSDGTRDMLEITDNELLKNYISNNAEELCNLSSEEKFNKIKEHLFRNLTFVTKSASPETVNSELSSSDNYMQEMEEREISNLVNKFGNGPTYKVATDSDGERLYIVNNNVYTFKTGSDGKRTIYPIVTNNDNIDLSTPLTEEEIVDMEPEQLEEQNQKEIESINQQKENNLKTEADKVKNSFETKPTEHNYVFNLDEFNEINGKLYEDVPSESNDKYVEPNFNMLSQEEMNLYYFDTKEMINKLPVIYEKNLVSTSEKIPLAINYIGNFVKYLKDRDPNSLNENEQAILDAYDNALYKIEENMNIKAVEAEEQIENVDEVIDDFSGEELSDSVEFDEGAYSHPTPGQHGRVRRLGQGEGTHGVALVLILLEIVAISILAVVFYNMIN